MQTINITEAKTSDLVAFYNANITRFPDGTAIKKFADRKTAEKRVADLVEKIASHFPEDETPEGTIPDPNVATRNESDTNESGQADGAATDDKNNEAAPESNEQVAPELSGESKVQPDMDGSRLVLEPTDQPTDAERAAMEESEYQIQAQGARPSGDEGEEPNADDEDEEDIAPSARGASAFNALQATLSALSDKSKLEAENGVKPVTRTSSAKASNSDGVAASWVDADIRAARLTRDGVKVELDGKEVGTFKSTREAFRNLRLPDNKHIRFRLKLKEAHRDQGEGADFEHSGKKYHFTIVQVDV
jgi:hypothetical protein